MKKITSKRNNRMRLRNLRRNVLESKRKVRRKNLRLLAEKMRKQPSFIPYEETLSL
jgi:hypothetical protein